jgi:hypothetical protein
VSLSKLVSFVLPPSEAATETLRPKTFDVALKSALKLEAFAISMLGPLVPTAVVTALCTCAAVGSVGAWIADPNATYAR